MVKSKKKTKKKNIDYKYNLKEYFGFVKRHRFLFGLMILGVIIAEALYVADKFLYKRLIDDAELFVAGNMLQNVFVQIALVIAGIYLGIVILRTFFSWMNGFLLSVIEPKLIYDLKQKYFNHILRLSHKFHAEHKTGSLISRLGRGAGAIESMTDLFAFQISPLILQFIMVFTSIAFFTWESAIVLLVVVVSFSVYSLYLQRLQKDAQVQWNKSKDKESGFIADVLTNVESVKYFGEEKRIGSRFDRLARQTRNHTRRYWSYFAKMGLGQILILGLGLLGLIYFPMKDFIAGDITLGTIVFIYSLYGNVAHNLFRFVWGIRSYYRSMADFQDLFDYGKETNDIKDKPGAKEINIKKGSIDFEKINFSYGEKKRILKNFDLKIKPNEKVAFVGHSGSGKTTIVKLLNRLYDVDSGFILIDGIDVRDVKQESLRNETGIVPQEPILFDDSIYNNIKFARPEAPRREIMRAIKLAQLDKIVKGFPKKENTIVGERGVKLSGGEKQRVSIARAILANKKILVLDEATSALDSQTEYEIQKALEKLLEGRTSIIIAHRLSTIMKADRIIVMDKGRIVEQGSHNQLLLRRGEYYKLWKMQSGGYIQE